MIDNYVTGANGFIGKRLVIKLEGETVTIPHNQIFNYQYRPFEKFFFLSAYGNMAHQRYEHRIIHANLTQPARALRYALLWKKHVKSFIYVSSSSVNLPVQTPYSRTKRAAEEMLQATSLPYCIVRPFSVCGVGEQKEHLIPTLIRSCMEGTPMPFVPDAVHDYIDVEDIVDGLLLLADKKATGIFELGRGTGYVNAEVLHLVEQACGKRANISPVTQLREYDNKDWVCKDFKARDIGWVPKKSLEDSIFEMVEAYRNEHA